MLTLPRSAALILLAALPAPAVAQSCFDPAQCAREAIMYARAASREVSALGSDLRTLRADRNALSTDIAALREQVKGLGATLDDQAKRIAALEAENAELRKAVGLPDTAE